MTDFDDLDIQVDGQRCYHSSDWDAAIKEFLDRCWKFGGKICFGGDEAGFQLSLIFGARDCSIALWSNDSAPPSNTLSGPTFHSSSEWDEVLESLNRFVDDEHIQMLVITNRHDSAKELRLWKKSDGCLGIAGTYPGR